MTLATSGTPPTIRARVVGLVVRGRRAGRRDAHRLRRAVPAAALLRWQAGLLHGVAAGGRGGRPAAAACGRAAGPPPRGGRPHRRPGREGQQAGARPGAGLPQHLPAGVRGHRPGRRLVPDRSTRSRSWSPSAAASWRCCARSGRPGGQGHVSVLTEAVVVGLVGATPGLARATCWRLGLKALFGQFGLDLAGHRAGAAAPHGRHSYGVGLVVTMVAAYLPARRASRVAPVAAMRDDVALPESSLRRRVVGRRRDGRARQLAS